jgi:hypothetical protein
MRLYAVADMHAIWRDGPGLGHAASCWPSVTGSRPIELIEWVMLLGQLRQVLSQALSNWPKWASGAGDWTATQGWLSNLCSTLIRSPETFN